MKRIVLLFGLAFISLGALFALNESKVVPAERPETTAFDGTPLTELERYVTLKDGTEKPFSNAYWDNKAEGIYVGVLSGEPLFASTDKFKSGTGWPSFTRPLESANIVEATDFKLGYPRTEVRSKKGDAHLGHVFKDGPKPTGLRYCINSAALRFIPKEDLAAMGYEKYESLFENTEKE